MPTPTHTHTHTHTHQVVDVQPMCTLGPLDPLEHVPTRLLRVRERGGGVVVGPGDGVGSYPGRVGPRETVELDARVTLFGL